MAVTPGGGIINNQQGGNPAAGVLQNTPAVVRVGKINRIDQSESVFNQDGPDVYDDYFIESRYERDLHRYMAGVTSPGGFGAGGGILSPVGGSAPPSAAFFQLAAPTLLWVVDWTAGRWGSKPKVPDPNIPASSPGGGGATWILLDAILETPRLDFDARNAKTYYRISGTYVYGCLNPAQNSILGNVRWPRAPVWNDLFDRTVSAQDVDSNLIG